MGSFGNRLLYLCATNYPKTSCNRFILKSFSKKQYSTGFKESKIAVDGNDINYVKVGDGDHAVLCLPGALGSIWSDFKPQIVGLNKSKFTVVAWDPPGYGKSRPPDRQFPPDFFHRDADCALKLMKALNLKRFSMLGWSDGGITALILAAKYPSNVQKLVVWGANAYVVDDEVKIYESIRDVSKWSERMRAPLVELYGDEYFRETWSSWVDAFLKFQKEGGDICKDSLPKIQCPTLVVHGSKDPMIASEHPKYLIDNIKKSKLHVFKEGKHNLHLRYSKEFNALVQDFLLD